MPLPPDFADESLYGPDAWFVHDLLDASPEGVLARMDTTRLGALVDAQRTFGGHVRHLPAAIAIQATGTLGSLHAVYGLGLRATDGWFGYGTHIRRARFPRIGEIGPPIDLRLTATRVRRIRGTVFIDYDFEYTQHGDVVYASSQTAAWARADTAAS